MNSLTRVNALAMDQEPETLTHSRASSSASALAAAVLLCEGEDAGLEVTAMAPESGLDFAAAAFEAIFTGWGNGADYQTGRLQRLSLCNNSDTAVAATIDSELCDLTCPVETIEQDRAPPQEPATMIEVTETLPEEMPGLPDPMMAPPVDPTAPLPVEPVDDRMTDQADLLVETPETDTRVPETEEEWPGPQ